VIVDLHAHLYHPTWYPEVFRDSVANDFIRRQKAAGRSASRRRAQAALDSLLPDGDGSRTLRLMDRVGVDKKTIMILDLGLALGEADKSIREINQEILGICARSSDRLVGFAGIDPRRPDATEIVRRSLDDWGAGGLKLHPTTGWRLADNTAHEVVALAVERRVPILVHIGKTIDELCDARARPRDIVALARRFPEGTFIAGHAGFGRWTEFADSDDLPQNLHCDISGWQELVEGDRAKLEHHLFGLMSLFLHRVHLGTDGPFYSFNLVASERLWLRLVMECLNGIPGWLEGARPSVLDSSALLTRPSPGPGRRRDS
jgi:uncharacterized protein